LLSESAKKAEGLRETGGKVHLGAPTYDAPGEGRIHRTSKLLARLGRTMFRIKQGQVVVMDNLSSHKGERVRQLIEGKGCELIYLPPYSLDFTP